MHTHTHTHTFEIHVKTQAIRELKEPPSKGKVVEGEITYVTDDAL
jgi:hypothetical protein